MAILAYPQYTAVANQPSKCDRKLASVIVDSIRTSPSPVIKRLVYEMSYRHCIPYN